MLQREGGASGVAQQPPACCEQREGVFATVGPIVTWILVILGWWIVHKSAVARARRQDDLATIDALSERIAELRTKAIAYYTTTSSSDPASAVRPLEAHLKHEVQSIVAAIRVLRTRRPRTYDVAGEEIKFRAAVTGGKFETGQRPPVPHDDPLVQAIWIASDNLCVTLREQFEKANR